jgi:hypothetical protein
MKTIIILFLLVISANIFSQDVTVKIFSNKSEYKKIYTSGENTDPILVDYTLYNNTPDSILIKFDPYFELTYTGDEYEGYSQCFRFEPVKINGEEIKWRFMYNNYSSFIMVPPNDSIVYNGEFNIYWPCRGMPPRDDWSFNITYRNKFTKDENYYLVQSRYTDFSSKEFIKAWEGELVSNTISLTIQRGW